MTVMAEIILRHVQRLQEPLQTEVLDFVEYLEHKQFEGQKDWSTLSLSSAMRDMENEDTPYSLSDLKEAFS